MELHADKISKRDDQSGKNDPATKKRSVRRLLHVLYLFMWVLGSCSLPEVPIEEPTETPTALHTATATASSVTATAPSPSPSLTPVLATPTVAVTPDEGLTPTPTEAGTIPPDGVETVENPRFGVQAGTPLGMANIARPDQGCNWMGIGGQVLDLAGMPVYNLVVEVGGRIGETGLLELALTGSEAVFGPGGYAIQIANQPVSSDGTVWMQLFDLAGIAQTRKIYLTTYADCERNLVLVNFSALYASSETTIYLPAVNKEP